MKLDSCSEWFSYDCTPDNIGVVTLKSLPQSKTTTITKGLWTHMSSSEAATRKTHLIIEKSSSIWYAIVIIGVIAVGMRIVLKIWTIRIEKLHEKGTHEISGLISRRLTYIRRPPNFRQQPEGWNSISTKL
ncbi:MAG: hypothetical protein P9L92_16175 [Candidatus Electryonea clarkiae]|nr:hypothetical protein [Candidatus Electryonea clarkiae]MDP8287896.1 hypothetical protein [Candidatus Electryonea clarkiae]